MDRGQTQTNFKNQMVNSKRKRVKANIEAEEAQVKAEESALLSRDWLNSPSSIDDFSRLLLLKGSMSAEPWIKFMAFWMEKGEIARAREVSEEAVKRIDASLDKERFDLFVSRLNLEAFWAVKESQTKDNNHSETSVNASDFEKAAKRACVFCNDKKIRREIPNIWLRVGIRSESVAALKAFVSKYPQSRKPWYDLIDYWFSAKKGNDLEQGRKVYADAMRRLPQRKRLDMQVHFARLELRLGSFEVGKSLFGKIFSEAPKRTDLRLVFVQDLKSLLHNKVLKSAADVAEDMRNALRASRSDNQAKAILKVWMQVEEDFGTEDGVEGVKQAAREYLEQSSRPKP